MNDTLIKNCRTLLNAYNAGLLGYMVMPEDSSPNFSDDQKETRLDYFTLPMSLNYQRDSYKLWESALKTYEDELTKDVFSVTNSARMTEDELRVKLVKHKVALQPNKHVATWQKINQTIDSEWGSLTGLFTAVDDDFLKLKAIIQGTHKKGFPYLSGPKIFNYWSFIISTYGKVDLKNKEFIEIAPDTHITKCSVLLGLITQDEAEKLSKDAISLRWREALHDSGITPIDMHPPLWFWSRNNFIYQLPSQRK